MPEESTTPDLVELTRRGYEAANRGDLQAALSFFAQTACGKCRRWEMRTSEGASVIREFCEVWWGAYDEYRIEPEGIDDLGSGVTFAVLNQGGRPVGSSGSVKFHYAGVSSWRNGLIERVTNYTDIDQGRAAAGRLAEERG